MDNPIKLLLETADESIIHDCPVNISRKCNFADFWSVTEQKLESLHAAAINDHQHSKTVASDLVLNMAHTVSSGDLHEQHKEEAIKAGIKNEKVPSKSWFCFQFWPKILTLIIH